MLVYLDTKDLINLLERDQPCSVRDLDAGLRAGSHILAVSFSNVKELSRPLLEPGSRTVVTQLLNRLETLPLRYIGDLMIYRDELSEAWQAFTCGREYQPVSPFAARMHRRMSLAEFVFDQWQRNADWLGPPSSHGLPPVKTHLKFDRTYTGGSDPASNFAFFVAGYLRTLATMRVLPDDVAAWVSRASDQEKQCFAGWIYAKTSRCPAVRLGDEFYHAVRKNVTYAPEDSLIGDLAHLACLPYVDLITLDRATRDHVRRISDRVMPGCADRVCDNLEELIRRLV
jgi:hypothetical protein